MKVIPQFPPIRRGEFFHEHMVPSHIKSSVGYDGWAVLSWALNHGWVQEYKQRFSSKEGRDVGVPVTIERMMSPQHMLLEEDVSVMEYLAKGAGRNQYAFRA